MKKISELITEAKNHKHNHGCMMLFLEVKNIEQLFEEIDEKDIFTKKDDDGYGIEKDTHVTIKFGFTDKVSDHEIMNICRDKKFDDVQLSEISLFENEEFDVLKIDVQSETLTKLNKQLSKFPNEDKYPDYHPHSTIAYIKKGLGIKYVDKFKNKKITLEKAVKLVYSNIDDTKLILDL